MTKWIAEAAVSEEYGISQAVVRSMIKKHRLPFHRPVRGTVLFDRKELEAWIERSRVAAPEVSL